jgi:hypothetical protein
MPRVSTHIALRWALSSACALFASQVLAQSAVQAGAADPGASVPATSYRPAISYRPEAAPAAPPDRNWSASNATVAAYNPMSLTMKGMKGMTGHDAPAPAQAPPHLHTGHAGHAGHADHSDHAGHAAAASNPPAPDHKESP